MRVIAAIVLCCAAATAVPASAQTAPPPPPSDPRLLVIGDSVLLGAHGSINQRLAIRGWYVQQVSRESMHVWQASSIIDSYKAVGGVGQVVIIQLGTNDGFSSSELAHWIDGVMPHLADVPRVYWVNLRQFASWVPAANATIAAAATKYPNMRVIDWDSFATPHPSLVYADGYHLNPTGQSAMADLLAATLDAYLLELAAAATTTTSTTVPTTSVTGSESSSSTVSRKPKSEGVELTTVAAATAGCFVVAGLLAVIVSKTGSRRRRSPLG